VSSTQSHVNNKGTPRGFGEGGNMISYFKGTGDIFVINFREQVISLLLKRTLTRKVEEKGNLYH